jgi:surfactin synthase thioesterase subunit
LAAVAPPDLDVVALRLPGRESRFAEPPKRHLGAVVDDLVEAVAQATPGRYAIFGQCSGAFLAIELARHLADATGRSPEVVFAASQEPPLEPADAELEPDVPAYVRLLVDRGELHSDLAENDDYMEMFENVIAADLAWTRSYAAAAPHPPIMTRLVSLCGASEDPGVLASQDGWAQLTDGPFATVRVEGGHFLTSASPDHLMRALVDQIEAR